MYISILFLSTKKSEMISRKAGFPVTYCQGQYLFYPFSNCTRWECGSSFGL